MPTPRESPPHGRPPSCVVRRVILVARDSHRRLRLTPRPAPARARGSPETTVWSPSGRKSAKPMCPGTPASASPVTSVSPVQRAADVAAGDRVHRLVAFVDHHRVLAGQQVIDRAVDRRLADHHLIGRIRIDGRRRGDRRIVEIDAAADSVEAKRDRPQSPRTSLHGYARDARAPHAPAPDQRPRARHAKRNRERKSHRCWHVPRYLCVQRQALSLALFSIRICDSGARSTPCHPADSVEVAETGPSRHGRWECAAHYAAGRPPGWRKRITR